MTSLSSDVTNAVWHAYHHHEVLVGQVSCVNLASLISRIGQIIGAPFVAQTLELDQTLFMSFGQFMCFLEKELFVPKQKICDIKSMQRSRDLIEEACWQECSPSVLKSRKNSQNFPEVAVYHIFRVYCFLAELKLDPQTSTMNVTICPEEAMELCQSFVQSLGKPWDHTSIDQDFFSKAMNFSTLLKFIETALVDDSDPRGITEAAAEIFDVFIGDVIKKGPVKRRVFGLWWDYVMVVRPHFLQFYNEKGKKISEFQISTRSTVRSSSCASENHLETTLPFLSLPGFSNNSSRSHKLFVITNNTSEETGGKVLEICAPCYKSKLQWNNAIQCAIAHSHSLRRYQSYLASQRKIIRHEERVREESREHEMELTIRSQIKHEISVLKNEIRHLKQKVDEETKAKRDEEIVRGAQSRLLMEEWEKMEKLQKELETTKAELKKIKSETISFRKSSIQRTPVHRAKSWSDIREIAS